MADVRRATEELLEEKPSLEEGLRAVLDVDRERDGWEFADIPLDSGEFGEVVSRGIVASSAGQYRVTDPEAVEGALTDDGRATRTGVSDLVDVVSPRRWVPTIDTRAAIAVLGVLGVLFLMRIVNYPAVFQGDRVVSPANDPYFYRYMNERLLERSTDPWSLEVVTGLPARAAERPFTHAANWWITALLGGDQWAADMTAAWLPVVATVVLGVIVYWTAVILTRDVRVGVASVFLLALVPIHAVYSGLGFLEHRLHQYLWLGVTLLALTWLAVDLKRRTGRGDAQVAVRGHVRSPWSWVAAAGLGLGLAISMHAWGGSVLMCIPVGAYLAVRVVLDVRDGIPPALANVPLLCGIGIATALSAFWHVHWGWHDIAVVTIPAMLVVGAFAVLALGELWRRRGWHLGGLLAAQAVGAGIGVFLFYRLFPDVASALRGRADDLFFREGAVEAGSLFGAEVGGGLFGPLFQIGLDFFLAVAILVWAVMAIWREYEPGWLVIVVYAAVWLIFSAVQVRFAAQLSIPLSILGGFGLVWALAWMDLARTPRPLRDDPSGARFEANTDEPSIAVPGEPAAIGYLSLTILLVSGMSLVFVPSLAAEVTYGEAEHAAIDAITDHVEAVDRETGEQFVFSDWGDNRMYNYFVHGDADTYAFAQAHYVAFVGSDDPDEWYDTLDGQVGYVVIGDLSHPVDSDTVHATLHDDLDLADGSLPSVGHYRLLSTGGGVSTYAVVPGATIEVNGTVETDVAHTTVDINGMTATYERELRTGDDGSDVVTVAYPGEYEIGDETVEITEEDVVDGATINVTVN